MSNDSQKPSPTRQKQFTGTYDEMRDITEFNLNMADLIEEKNSSPGRKDQSKSGSKRPEKKREHSSKTKTKPPMTSTSVSTVSTGSGTSQKGYMNPTMSALARYEETRKSFPNIASKTSSQTSIDSRFSSAKSATKLNHQLLAEEDLEIVLKILKPDGKIVMCRFRFPSGVDKREVKFRTIPNVNFAVNRRYSSYSTADRVSLNLSKTTVNVDENRLIESEQFVGTITNYRQIGENTQTISDSKITLGLYRNTQRI